MRGVAWEGQFTAPKNMPVRKTRKTAKKLKLEVGDSSDEDGGTAGAENLEDKASNRDSY